MSIFSDSTAPGRSRNRWLWWLFGGLAGLLLGATLAVLFGLDPWLRRKLEKTVAEQTHGQYRLRVGSLKASLGARAVHLRGLELRPATAAVADTLPYLALRLGRLDLSGVSLLVPLRGPCSMRGAATTFGAASGPRRSLFSTASRCRPNCWASKAATFSA